MCSECGLGFAWADVLDPARRNVRWLYDHAAGRRPRLLRAAKTWVAMAAPWWFWKRVGVGGVDDGRARGGRWVRDGGQGVRDDAGSVDWVVRPRIAVNRSRTRRYARV
ncbi:MAG: hypothetical protein ACK4WH_01610 [Phycisphaerales bacterium]